jgi:hypothetical protein
MGGWNIYCIRALGQGGNTKCLGLEPVLEVKLLGEERDMKVAVGSEDVEGWMGWEVWWWLFALLSLLLLYYYCYRSRG